MICLRVLILVAAAYALGAYPCSAQADVEEEDPDIYLSINVGYNSAYRDNSWVPVDVIVVNELEDVSGWIEVRLTDFTGETQSPIYRVPADCPSGSKKRFRVYCRMNGTRRVEAWLYHKNRPAHEVPAWYALPPPIARTDLLALILDDNPSDFGFLYMAVQEDGTDRRLHRQELTTRTLGNLPDYPQCYEAFDLIVMGDIDPRAFTMEHRDLIRQYVRGGGLVVVCLGASAAKYRATWVEELMGLEVGEALLTNERDLATAVFPTVEPRHVSDTRQCMVAQLTAAKPDVKKWRHPDRPQTDIVLAAIRPYGQGHVAVITIDAASRALQRTTGYRDIWKDLTSLGRQNDTLNFDEAGALAAYNLPRIAGITIYSKSSVMAYLGLYFFVGIVGNWLFWNYFKRREMAWLCLVLFSLGFTGYAIFFGSVGRAKSSTLERIDVVRIPKEGDMAEAHSFVGIINARSGRYDIDIKGRYALTSDVSTQDMQGLYGMYRTLGRSRPYYAIEDINAKIENLPIGASELRMVQIDARIPVQGPCESRLELDDSGLHGTIANHTGFNLDSVVLVIDGAIYALPDMADGTSLEVSFDERSTDYSWRQGGGIYNTSDIKMMFVSRLFSQSAQHSRGFFGQWSLSPYRAPLLVAFSQVPPDIVHVEDLQRGTLAETIVIAELNLQRSGRTRELWEPLNVAFNRDQVRVRSRPFGPTPPVDAFKDIMFLDRANELSIPLPETDPLVPVSALAIDVFMAADENMKVILEPIVLPRGNSPYDTGFDAGVVTRPSETVQKITFKISDPASRYPEKNGVVTVRVNLRIQYESGQSSATSGDSNRPSSVVSTQGGDSIPCHISVRMLRERKGIDDKEWVPWQS